MTYWFAIGFGLHVGADQRRAGRAPAAPARRAGRAQQEQPRARAVAHQGAAARRPRARGAPRSPAAAPRASGARMPPASGAGGRAHVYPTEGPRLPRPCPRPGCGLRERRRAAGRGRRSWQRANRTERGDAGAAVGAGAALGRRKLGAEEAALRRGSAVPGFPREAAALARVAWWRPSGPRSVAPTATIEGALRYRDAAGAAAGRGCRSRPPTHWGGDLPSPILDVPVSSAGTVRPLFGPLRCSAAPHCPPRSGARVPLQRPRAAGNRRSRDARCDIGSPPV